MLFLQLLAWRYCHSCNYTCLRNYRKNFILYLFIYSGMNFAAIPCKTGFCNARVDPALMIGYYSLVEAFGHISFTCS